MGATAEAYRVRPKAIRLWLNEDNVLEMTASHVAEGCVTTILRCMSSSPIDALGMSDLFIFWGDMFEAVKIDYDDYKFFALREEQDCLHFATRFDERTIPEALANEIRALDGEVDVVPVGLYDYLVIHIPREALAYNPAVLLTGNSGIYQWTQTRSGPCFDLPLQPSNNHESETPQRRRRSLKELFSQPIVTSLDSQSKTPSRSTWTGPILLPISSVTEPPTKPLHPQVANRQREIQAKREAMKGKPEKEWLKTDGDVFGLEKK